MKIDAPLNRQICAIASQVGTAVCPPFRASAVFLVSEIEAALKTQGKYISTAIHQHCDRERVGRSSFRPDHERDDSPEKGNQTNGNSPIPGRAYAGDVTRHEVVA